MSRDDKNSLNLPFFRSPKAFFSAEEVIMGNSTTDAVTVVLPLTSWNGKF
jgi:hypothetical protein